MTTFSEPICDFCGRSGGSEADGDGGGTDLLKMDADGLWVCPDCRSRVTSKPSGDIDLAPVPEELQRLVGKSAGAICRTLQISDVAPFQTVLRAAEQIGYDDDLYLSAWSFKGQWLDGTTVWFSGDGSEKALVTAEGNITIDPR